MRWMFAGLAFVFLIPAASSADAAEGSNHRKPASERELRDWLENMVWYHRFSDDEISQATGLKPPEIAAARVKWNIAPVTRPRREHGAPLLVLPYPGGRHPRIGFLEGAVQPQRETKVSVFAPWDETSYVVVDTPEAIWSNLGLTYLAHTHVPTIWTKQNVALPSLEWERLADGSLRMSRTLPNKIAFSTHVRPEANGVRFEMSLTNGTGEKLTDLRVQMCAMLKGMAGFSKQTNSNKVFASPFAACRSDDGKRWVLMAWDPCHRAWGNERCPCLHSDPKFPDCPSGERRHVRGWLSFFEGANIQKEFERLERAGLPNK